MKLRALMQKFAGPRPFGIQLAHEARQGGNLLAQTILMGHGTLPEKGPPRIFATEAELLLWGFKPWYHTKCKLDLTLLSREEQVLFKSILTATMAYLFTANSLYSGVYMRDEKALPCIEGLKWRIAKDLVSSGLFATMEIANIEIISYYKAVDLGTLTTLDFDSPAFGDILDTFIDRAAQKSQSKLRYGFSRTGPDAGLGIDVMALAAVGYAKKQISDAAKQYGWGR